MLPLFFSEGQFIETLALTDRSIHYGDGLFETMVVSNNSAELLVQHLDRLERSCNILKMPYVGHQFIISAIKTLLSLKPQQQAILKIILTRGSGGRGYALPKVMKPTTIFALYPLPNDLQDFAQKGINVFLCKTKLAYNSVMAGLKHLNRLEQVLGAAEFDDSLYQEGLMFDGNDYLIEGTKTNVFIVHDNVLKTPALISNGVEGIMKNLILEIAMDLDIKTEQCQLDLNSIEAADEIFVCNSVIKIWPVHTIKQYKYRNRSITKKIAEAIPNKISYYENY